MPYAKGNKRMRKPYKRPVNKSYKTSRVTTQSICKSITIPGRSPIPLRWNCNHRYVEHALDMSATLGVGAQYVFSLGNLFDPNVSGVGHQPYGRDSLVSLYDRYQVNSLTYKFTFYGMSGSGVAMTVMPRVLGFSPSSPWTVVSEKPGAKTKVLSVQSSDSERSISGTIQLHNAFGITRMKYLDDNNYTAQSGSSTGPLIPGYIDIYSGARSPTDSTTIYLKVQLSYNVTWYSPVILAQS